MRLSPNPYLVALSVALAAGCASNEETALEENLSAADAQNAANAVTDLGYLLVSPNVADSPATIIESSSSRVAYTFATPNRASRVTVEVRGVSSAILQKLNGSRWTDVAELEAIRPPGAVSVQKHFLTSTVNGTYRVLITRLRPSGNSPAAIEASTIRLFAQDNDLYCVLAGRVWGQDKVYWLSGNRPAGALAVNYPSSLTTYYNNGNTATKNRIASTLGDTQPGQAVRARASNFSVQSAIATRIASNSSDYFVTALRHGTTNYEMHSSALPNDENGDRGLVFRQGSSVPVYRLNQGAIQGCGFQAP